MREALNVVWGALRPTSSSTGPDEEDCASKFPWRTQCGGEWLGAKKSKTSAYTAVRAPQSAWRPQTVAAKILPAGKVVAR